MSTEKSKHRRVSRNHIGSRLWVKKLEGRGNKERLKAKTERNTKETSIIKMDGSIAR